MREVNKVVFRFSELLKYQFESFIDFYDYEECEKIMEEDDEEQLIDNSSTGSDHFLPPKQELGRSVLIALDGLRAIMAKNSGQLPI